MHDVALLPTPAQQPRTPIVVGGIWPRKPAIRRGGRWDGIMTHFPGDGVMPADEIAPEQHAMDMVAHYTSIAEEPGEVFLPAHPEHRSSEWFDLAEQIGATWLYTAKHHGEWSIDLDRIGEGPQAS